MSKVFSKKSFILLTAVVLFVSGFFMFAGTASAALTWSADAGMMDWNAGTAYCGSLSTDQAIVWRLPSPNELVAAYTSGVPGSFANVIYWSGTTNPDNSNFAYYVYMNSGSVNYDSKTAPGGYVRCVRSTADVVWQSGAGTTMDWNAGTAYCGGLSTDQAIVWRLPSVTELQTAYTSGVPGSFADSNYNYWSGITRIGYSPGAYILNMSNGGLGSGDKAANSSSYIRCVRDATTYAVADGTMTRAEGDLTSTIDIATSPAEEGATVTLTVVPKTGMQLQVGTLVASYNDGSPKTLTLSGSGPYTFTMPAYPVTVTATFEAENEPVTGSGDAEESYTKADVDSWSAFQYTDNSKCIQRLELTINGHHFDKDAEVFIGSKEASSVSRRSSQKIVAKFCLTKILDNKADHERVISVKNPHTDSVKADKQIDLDNLSSKNGNVNANNTNPVTSNDYYDQKTKEGAKHIQEALNKLEYLDAENITSTYGSITTDAVKKFQSDNGIEATGFVGELTKTKLAEKIK